MRFFGSSSGTQSAGSGGAVYDLSNYSASNPCPPLNPGDRAFSTIAGTARHIPPLTPADGLYALRISLSSSGGYRCRLINSLWGAPVDLRQFLRGRDGFGNAITGGGNNIVDLGWSTASSRWTHIEALGLMSVSNSAKRIRFELQMFCLLTGGSTCYFESTAGSVGDFPTPMSEFFNISSDVSFSGSVEFLRLM